MDIATQIGDSTEGIFPLTRQQEVRYRGSPVGYRCRTNAGFRTAYVSERYRSKGHRYEKQNAYAVSTSLLRTAAVNTVDCIIIVDHDEGEAYVYDRDYFSFEAMEAIPLNWHDQQLAVPVSEARVEELPDQLWASNSLL